MTTPVVVVDMLVLQVLHPPDFTQLTVVLLPEVVLWGLQSGLFGSDLVHSHSMVTVPPTPPARRRAVSITVGVTSRSPGRSLKQTAERLPADVAG
jgi:hypothetical protein